MQTLGSSQIYFTKEDSSSYTSHQFYPILDASKQNKSMEKDKILEGPVTEDDKRGTWQTEVNIC